MAELLGGAELVPMTALGDRDPSSAGDKARWVEDLEHALLAGEADLAVHSAKDVPGRLADGLELVGAPPREDPRDVLVGAEGLAALPSGARVGTSALRRAAQVRAARDDLEVVELRGNVDTRLRKLAGGETDALVLAAAGLRRLGRADAAAVPLDFVPAPGQGTLALQARVGDEPVAAAAAAITDEHAWTALRCERALARALGADCRTPVGAHACATDGRLRLRAFVGAPDGSTWLRDELDGEDPEALGAAVAGRLLAAGANEVLGR